MLTTSGLWAFILRPATLAALGLTALLAWPVGRRLAGRHRCPSALAAAFVIAVGVVLALTLTPNEPALGDYIMQPPQYLSLLFTDPAALWAQFVTMPWDAEQIANVVLYIPVGLLGALVWRSAVRGSLFGLLLTVVVETCQFGIIGRAGSLTDIRNNTTGAVLGALTAVAARRIFPQLPPGRGRRQPQLAQSADRRIRFTVPRR